MDSFFETARLFSTPSMWAAIFLCVSVGLLGLAGPRFLTLVNTRSKQWIDSSKFFAFMDQSIDVDGFFLKHSRLFGLIALAAAGCMYYLSLTP